MMEEIQQQENAFENKIDFYSQIVERVSDIKKHSEKPDTEILQFFFDN